MATIPQRFDMIEKQWAQYKTVFAELCFGQRQSPEYIVKHMLQVHGFQTTAAALQAQFKKWGLSKNLKRPHWEAIDYKCKKRKRNGKESEILVHGVNLPRDKVTKQVCQQGVFKATDIFNGVQTPSVSLTEPEILMHTSTKAGTATLVICQNATGTKPFTT